MLLWRDAECRRLYGALKEKFPDEKEDEIRDVVWTLWRVTNLLAMKMEVTTKVNEPEESTNNLEAAGLILCILGVILATAGILFR